MSATLREIEGGIHMKDAGVSPSDVKKTKTKTKNHTVAALREGA
jgi:hypothetical protein